MAISLVVERPTPKNMRQFGISTNKKWKKNLLKAPLSRSSLLYQYESPIGCFSSACYLDRLDPWELDRLDNCKWHPRCPTSAPKKPPGCYSTEGLQNHEKCGRRIHSWEDKLMDWGTTGCHVISNKLLSKNPATSPTSRGQNVSSN